MIHDVIFIAIGAAIGQIPAVAVWVRGKFAKVEAAAAPVVAAVEKKI